MMLNIINNPIRDITQTINELYPDIDFNVILLNTIDVEDVIVSRSKLCKDKYSITLHPKISFDDVPGAIINAVAGIIARTEDKDTDEANEYICEYLVRKMHKNIENALIDF
jgi:hypothetical protein